jgi:TetR/AcrR family transcriptional regulator, lmrAB and yxaGH operons repressor
MAKDTRSRMLETTARLLQHRGYHGTSLNDILVESGAPRGSLYFHFPGGKDQLVLEATRATVDATTNALKEALHGAETPARGIRSFFEAAAAEMTEADYTFGCPVAPVILDAAGGSEELAELCRKAFEEWIGLVGQALLSAGVQPERARSLALLVEASIEGLLLIARAYRDCTSIFLVAAELERLIESATPP